MLGASGCGKSKFVSGLIMNLYKDFDLKENYRVVAIDPHASLCKDLGRIGKVVDFNTQKINLFASNTGDLVSGTELMLDLFKTLLGPAANSKNERVLRHAIYLLLAARALNFENLKKLFLELEYRNKLVKEMTPVLPFNVANFFLSEFNELKTKSYMEAIAPIVGFIDEMEILPALNTMDASSLGDTVRENFLTIFSLDRTKLGNKIVQTVAGLIMTQMLDLAQSGSINQQIILVIDEVAVVENPILVRLLSEARKYNLAVVLVGQYFNQFSVGLQNSVFTNVVNYYVFRLSRKEALMFADNLNFKIPMDNTAEQRVRLLTELNNRECLVRISREGKLYPAFKAITMEFGG